jgi:hypothetical protein
MQLQEAAGDGVADHMPLLREHGREPGGLTRSLSGVDVDLAPAGVHQDEPDQPAAHDQTDDQQPPVEFGVHRPEV